MKQARSNWFDRLAIGSCSAAETDRYVCQYRRLAHRRACRSLDHLSIEERYDLLPGYPAELNERSVLMVIAERAHAFVHRADTGLADLANSTDLWESSIRSKSEEKLLHVFPIDLDNAIRKVPGQHEAWDDFSPSQVPQATETAPMTLFWVLGAHPSGRVRQAVVQAMADFESDRILPHLANRAIDFVPEVRNTASPLLLARLSEYADARQGPQPHGVLPTCVHIAITKLLAPRAASVAPELIAPCLELAESAEHFRPGQPRPDANMDRLLEPYRQSLRSTSSPASHDALQQIVAYLERISASSN